MTTATDALTTIQALIVQYQSERGALLPLLHAIQDKLGYIPDSALQPIADALQLSRAEVFGVVSYYHHFRTTPPPQHQLQVCRAEACQAMGSDALWQHACQHNHANVHHEAVYCLGLCATAPAIRWNEQPMARMHPDKLDQLLQQAQGGRHGQ